MGNTDITLQSFFDKSETETIKYLLEYWEIQTNEKNKIRLIGTYEKVNKPDKNGKEYGFFSNIKNLNGDIIFYPFNLGQVRIFSMHNENYSADYSQIEVVLSKKQFREINNNPFLLNIDRVLENVPLDFITKIFLDKDTQTEKQIAILSKLQTNEKFELLKCYSHEFDFYKTFNLLENFVKNENSLSNYFRLSDEIFNTEFWINKKGYEIVDLFNNYVNNEVNDELRYELFFKGYVKTVAQRLVFQNIINLNEIEYRKLIQSQPENNTFIKEILEAKITTEYSADYDWLYDLAIINLSTDEFNSFDTRVFENLEKSEYFKLWKKGKAKIFPDNHIGDILNDEFNNYFEIKNWINSNITSEKEINDFLFSHINIQVPVTNRKIFYKQFNHIKYLLQKNNNIQKVNNEDDLFYEEIKDSKQNENKQLDKELFLQQIKQLNNAFYNVILWFLDKIEVLDFEQLKQKFIYFEPDEQVRIIRKLFSLKANGEFELTVEKLNELSRFDLDLYKTNQYFNPEIPIDISTEVLIKVLLAYKQSQRFFVESELLTLILNDLNFNKKIRFKLSKYFENCLGREAAVYWYDKIVFRDENGNYNFKFYFNKILVKKLKEIFSSKKGNSFIYWNSDKYTWVVPLECKSLVQDFANNNDFVLIKSIENKIQKIYFQENNKFYFAISFTSKIKDFYRDKSENLKYTLEEDASFNDFLSEVKKLPGAKWNPDKKHWGVPSMYNKEVIEFAYKFKFYLDFNLESNDKKNISLYQFKRIEKPNGISFCEGRLANRPHDMIQKEFWWCGGQLCFSKCETIHSEEKWEFYTLLDFCEILGFNTDETNKNDDFIPKGKYYQFISLINRFNRLLDKLYCQDCNHILYPVEIGNFAAHNVVRFQCKNVSCSNNNEIYLNHCLNGQCNCVIDSRVSKKCNNGLYICDNCGSCCSHNMLDRRLENLILTGGYIQENLRKCVSEKLGHLEKAEYYCHNCGNEMTESNNEVYECSCCEIKYDTTKYKIKRPHIHLRKTKVIHEKPFNNENNEDDFMF